MSASMVFDAKYYKIPNQLIGLGYITGAMLNIESFGPGGVINFIVSSAVPIILLYLLFVLRGIGAGDIKLLSVTASMVGAELAMRAFMLSVLIAAVVAVYLCIREKTISKRKLHYSYYISAAYFLLQLHGSYV